MDTDQQRGDTMSAVDFSGLPQLSVSERVARGKAARREVPRSSHASVRAGGASARPGRAAGAPGRHPLARARPHPLRADARLAVHLLSRRGADHGCRPGPDSANGLHRPVLRRCPPLELRPLRLARATARLRHQRLRRDAARAVGMGRQAARGEHADLRAQQRLHGRGAGAASSSRPSPPTAPGWRDSPGCAISRSGTPASRSRS